MKALSVERLRKRCRIAGFGVLLFMANAGTPASAAGPDMEPDMPQGQEKDAAPGDLATLPQGPQAPHEPHRSPAGRSNQAENADSEDDFDFSWLDADKKVYVIQNRKYRKAWHPALYVGGAMNLSNEFRNGYGGVGRLSMWFTEQFGAEAFFGAYQYSNNNTLKALQAQSTAMPFKREIRNYMGVVGTWAPFYGKFNFFNHILYYDWSLNAGFGSVNTANDRNTVSGLPSNFVSESFMGIFFGTAQNFYVTRHFSVRLELIGVNYGAKGGDDQPRRYTNFDFVAGVGYLF